MSKLAGEVADGCKGELPGEYGDGGCMGKLAGEFVDDCIGTPVGEFVDDKTCKVKGCLSKTAFLSTKLASLLKTNETQWVYMKDTFLEAFRI